MFDAAVATPSKEAAPWLKRAATSPQLPALRCGVDAAGGLGEACLPQPHSPVGPQHVAQQLSLPAGPQPILIASSGCGSPGACGGFSPFAGLLPAAEPWAAAPSRPDDLAQLAVFSQAAAQREAERQLSLLQQLKDSITAGCDATASSCGSHPGASPMLARCNSLASQQQLSPPRRPGGPLLLPHCFVCRGGALW